MTPTPTHTPSPPNLAASPKPTTRPNRIKQPKQMTRMWVGACLVGMGIAMAALSAQAEEMTAAPSDILAEREVTIYTSSPELGTDTAKIWQDFTQKTGIKINIVNGEFDQLRQRLRKTGQMSAADLLVAESAEQLSEAARENLFQPTASTPLNAIVPAHLRSAKGLWYGLGERAYVMVYNQNTVESRHLSSYEALSDPKFKGRILVGSATNSSVLALITSVLAADGPSKTEKWASGLVRNFARPPLGDDAEQIRAVANGIGDVALVPTDALAKALASDAPEDKDIGSKIGVFFPNQKDRGTQVNLLGAGIARFAPHRAEAQILLEYLANLEGQSDLTETLWLYPVNNAVLPPLTLQNWGKFKAATLKLDAYSLNMTLAARIADKAGWR
ncbi:MAG: extracellular solute-binding protein [Candidatus Symbiobacter sp.]|nr:extracellular solute-binding protein [Candidatus Symbiobacter sp.]